MRNHLISVVFLHCLMIVMHQVHAEESVDYDCSNAATWDDCAPLIKKYEEKQAILDENARATAREAKLNKQAVKILVEGGLKEEVVRKYFDACDSGSFYPMAVCAEYGYTVADIELNNAYKSAIKHVHGTVAENALIKAQRAWLTFREATCSYEVIAWTNSRTYPAVYFACMANSTNERTEKLKTYAQCELAGCPGDWE